MRTARRRGGCWIVLAAVVLTTGVQAAPKDEAAAVALLERAKKQLRDFNDKAALGLLARARRAAKDAPEILAQVYLHEGLVLADLADEPGAIQKFERALALNAGLSLPANASPRVQQWWKRAGGPVAAPPGPTLTVGSAASLPPLALQYVPLSMPQGELVPPASGAPVLPSPRSRWSLGAGVGLLGGAVGGAILGGHLHVQAVHRTNDANRSPEIGPALALKSRAQTSETGAHVAFAVAGVLALGATAVFVFE